MEFLRAIIIVFSFLHALADVSTTFQSLEQVQEAQRQYQAQAQYFPKPEQQKQSQTFQKPEQQMQSQTFQKPDQQMQSQTFQKPDQQMQSQTFQKPDQQMQSQTFQKPQTQVQTQTFHPQPLGQPQTQGQQNQGMQPRTQGQQNQQGLQPPTQGQGQGLKPPTQGQQNQGLPPPTHGQQNQGQGQLPPTQGQQNQRHQPPTQGQQNQGQGLQPPAQGQQNQGQGLQPPAQGQPQIPTPTDQSTLKAMYEAMAAAKPQAYLAAHNAVRQQMKVPALQWDKKLEDYAFNYGSKLAKENCLMKHSGGPYGENLFWELYDESTPAQVIQSFASEQKDYDFQKGECKCEDSGKCMCGHFTAVVWKTTQRVGCAELRCDAEKGKMVVCSYEPKGNIIGEDPLKDKHDL